jgi:hypothetical protein
VKSTNYGVLHCKTFHAAVASASLSTFWHYRIWVLERIIKLTTNILRILFSATLNLFSLRMVYQVSHQYKTAKKL